MEKPSSTGESSKIQLKVMVTEWLQSTSIHGINNIFKSNYTLIRIIWLISVILSTGACAYYVITNIIDYLKFEAITRMTLRSETPTLFPTITICNKNQFVTKEGEDYVEKVLSQFNLLNTTDYGMLSYVEYIAMLNAKNPSLSDDFRKTLGLNLSVMMINCFYNGLRCSANDFEWFYDMMNGNCYRFNSGKNLSGHQVDLLQAHKSGRMNGLTLELFVGDSQYPSKFGSLKQTTGVHLFVHNSSVIPSIYEGFDAPTGLQSNFEISRLFVNKLGYPFSGCVNDDESPKISNPLLFNILTKDNKKYRLRDCLDLCYQKFVTEQCQCYDLNFSPLDSTTPPCLDVTQVGCDQKAYINFISKDIYSLCSDYCPSECNSFYYGYSYSASEYPSYAYGQIMMKNQNFLSKFHEKNVTFDQLKRSVLSVQFYYGDFIYTVVEDIQSRSIFDLISGVGGTFGLFLGFSFLSFIEILELLMDTLYITALSIKKNNDKVFNFKNEKK